VEFEPTIPAFEPAKTTHALDCAATVIDYRIIIIIIIAAVSVVVVVVVVLKKKTKHTETAYRNKVYHLNDDDDSLKTNRT
jgi:hypothetical protein